ncbi:MAG: hypothetical protein UY63_C0020G0010 [Parcubacteria group bacterium GW2011_GWA2_51_10]|nr:MAG: hypothetical protein UY63_C0020G0010 [Parcubacteria group bacterium GW2011_GWA2_51_10]
MRKPVMNGWLRCLLAAAIFLALASKPVSGGEIVVPAEVMIAAFVHCAEDPNCTMPLKRFGMHGISGPALDVRGEYGELLRCVYLDDKEQKILKMKTFAVVRMERMPDTRRWTRAMVLMDYNWDGTFDGILIPETTIVIRPDHAEWERDPSARLRAFHAAIKYAWDRFIPQNHKEWALQQKLTKK